ncbi:MAG: response regulator [Treponema sp.]|jgi:signal transduction histidine kinase/ActR/RegA family two-component response regulator/HPt (histidine-containing phosphotransfer) domain-containing protein|nr:response regulator [Treponema sp.]
MKAIGFFKAAFFHRDAEFRVKIYNLLAMAGMIISVLAGIMELAYETVAPNLISFAAAFLLSVVLLLFSHKTGRYQLCYMITIIVVFLLLFPAMFFNTGGYHGSMPCWFVFAVAFTVFMLEGKKALVVGTIEILGYAGIILLAWREPSLVRFPADEEYVLIDMLTTFLLASLTLGGTLWFYLKLYQDQQRQTEQAREEALALSKVKSNFLANMSHEIRSPINVILGMNEMILRESEDDRIAAYSRNIEGAGKSLLGLISNVLDFSRIESGKEEVIEESYKTADLIRELVIMGRTGAEKEGLCFELHVDENLPVELIGDFIHLRQVAVNFLSNAVKYTERGTVTLSVAGKKEVRKPGNPDSFRLAVTVKDTGIGIRDEQRELLFDAFTRLDIQIHRNIEGAGLGLSIARELTELMGGLITVESVWGRGSVFTVEVPQKIKTDSAPADASVPGSREPVRDATDNGSRDGGGSFTAPEGRVLVVDDNRENLLVIESLLRRTMLHVDTVQSGAECLEAVTKKDYHVSLRDYMMSGLDGRETFRRLRETGFAMPVIALTADAVAGAEQKFLKEGFAAYLCKPVQWQDLETALRTVLPDELTARRVKSEEGGGRVEGEGWREGGKAWMPPLAEYGVMPEQGLRYLSGDMAQYKRMAEIFIKNCRANREAARDMAERSDWEALKFSFHSLKSQALSMGAQNLSADAARLEQYCREEKERYIQAALPLVFLEWEEIQKGLEQFVGRDGESEE